MKLETKFNRGDLVFFMRDNKVRSGKIEEFTIECKYYGGNGNWGSKAYPVKYKYTVRESVPGSGTMSRTLDSNLIFSDKQKLLDSII